MTRKVFRHRFVGHLGTITASATRPDGSVEKVSIRTEYGVTRHFRWEDFQQEWEEAPGAKFRESRLVGYVAGAYRAKTINEIFVNITKARVVAAGVWKAGFAAVCPHMNTAMMDGLVDDEEFLQGALEIMRRCDFVVLVPGFEHSEGTREEIREADRLGIPVFDLKYVNRYRTNVAHEALRARKKRGEPDGETLAL